jgi:septum formation protein
LASSSPARLSLLKAAGIDPEIVVPTVDEQALTEKIRTSDPGTSTSHLVQYLANAKAESVIDDPKTHGALVLGGDSAL